jgi:hypothetical protein
MFVLIQLRLTYRDMYFEDLTRIMNHKILIQVRACCSWFYHRYQFFYSSCYFILILIHIVKTKLQTRIGPGYYEIEQKDSKFKIKSHSMGKSPRFT